MMIIMTEPYDYYDDIDDKYLTNFGIQTRPYCYAIPIEDLQNLDDL